MTAEDRDAGSGSIDLENPAQRGKAIDEDLLSRWLAVSAGAGPVLPVVDRNGPILASPSQRGLWLAQEIEGDTGTAMATRHLYRLRGQLDVSALSRALDQLVERHEVLRTSFRILRSELIQVIGPAYPLNVVAEPLAGGSGAQGSDIRTAVGTAMRDPLDLASGRIMLARLYRVADDDHILILIIHHIALDGWSMTVLHRELAELYDAAHHHRPPDLEPIRHQYADFAQWQRQEVAKGSYEEGAGYWRGALAGVKQPMPIPTDRPRPPTQSFRGGWRLVPIPGEVVDRVDIVARDFAATPHMVTLAVFLAVLAAWTTHSDLVVGTAVNHRPLPETEEMVGPFASILPVRYTVDSELSFRAHLARVKEQTIHARAHENVPLELILGCLGIAHSPAYNPIVQVTMTYKTGVVEDLRLGDLGLTVELMSLEGVEVQRDLAVEIVGDRGDTLSVGYASDLWDQSTIDALAAAYLVALDHWTKHLDEPLRALRLSLPAGQSPTAPSLQPTSQIFADNAVSAELTPDGVDTAVRQAWLEVLELSNVDPVDDFFDLGGESLGAMRICNRVGAMLGGRIPLRILYENSQLREFAAQVRARAGELPVTTADRDQHNADAATVGISR